MIFASALDWFKNTNTSNNEADNPYLILGLSPRASDEEIKRTYRKLMMANHPDVGGDSQATLSINRAYKAIRLKRGI